MTPPAIHIAPTTHWATAAFPHAADLLPAELKALGAHVARCNGARDRWFSLHCAAETAHAFIAPRFVTTLAVAMLAFGASVLLS